ELPPSPTNLPDASCNSSLAPWCLGTFVPCPRLGGLPSCGALAHLEDAIRSREGCPWAETRKWLSVLGLKPEDSFGANPSQTSGCPRFVGVTAGAAEKMRRTHLGQ